MAKQSIEENKYLLLNLYSIELLKKKKQKKIKANKLIACLICINIIIEKYYYKKKKIKIKKNSKLILFSKK